MVFARSNRSTVRFASAMLAVALVFAVLAVVALARRSAEAAVAISLPALVAGAVAARSAVRLRRWPHSRLGFFRDRLVLVQGRVEIPAVWDQLDTVTLADQGDWAAARWPEITLTDRLTVRTRQAQRFSFRPATFGVDPAACRDLMLRLRDEPDLRRRLPVFDSSTGLASIPLRTGELAHPEI